MDLATFGTIYTTDPHLQNTANIVSPVDSSLIFLTISPCRPCALSLKRSRWLAIIFWHFFLIRTIWLSNSLSERGKNFKKTFLLENITRTSLRRPRNRRWRFTKPVRVFSASNFAVVSNCSVRLLLYELLSSWWKRWIPNGNTAN